ncbi:MAG: LysR family transcriptional regulator [Novosphingobium sp.]|uniref:LysR family transcriptional regulator n=1 Tax=Novosphingobium sp. TaxID=1874826 RepID=UPI0022BFA616|nr:LysR family transcriptional regulator [Novosphingobium sp.]MCZ8036517.1 LysR family transcriptional regulator [Novosphingobium sp.]
MIGRVSDIDLRLLRIFREVVEAGGFAVATAKLNVAESTISQHMTDLEKRLGVRLCERGRAGFRLTDVGQEVYEATMELLHDLDRFRDRLQEASAQVSGRVSLGLPDAIVTLDEPLLRDGLARFAMTNPAAHLHVEMASPREIERGVIENRLHAAIAPEHRRIAGLDYRPLFSERNLLFCGRGNVLFGLDPGMLTEDMLNSQRRIDRGYLEGFDAEIFCTDRHAATVYQTEAAALLILTTDYIGFLPEHYARRWVDEGRMQALVPERYSFDAAFCLISRKERAEDQRVRLLVKAFSRG